MMRFYLLLVVLMSLHVITNAQVTNLTVNGSSASFSMNSGGTIHWEYDIPSGQGALCEIYLDINNNQVIDLASDKLLFTFIQTDGDTNGNGGPPDIDGIANGHVIFEFALGFAPGNYIMKFTHNSVGAFVPGTILPLSLPDFTISGTVTPPPGKSAQYVLVEADRDSGNSMFWDGLTDNAGHYSIAMRNDGDPRGWRVRVSTGFPPNIVTPDYINVTNGSSHSGVDFSVLVAAAQVAGYLRDDAGNPVVDRDLWLGRNDGGAYHNGRTNASGFFQIGILNSELNSQTWQLQASCNCGQITYSELIAKSVLPVINSGDSLYRELVVYNANATIQGHVLVNGIPPTFNLQVIADNPDSGQALTQSDNFTGNFSLNVSNKIHSYNVFVQNIPFNWQSSSVVGHAGDVGVVVNVTITSVQERESGIPLAFSLKQNYPNPFNPSTSIDYDIAASSQVKLTVLNLLGQEVATLIDERQPAGKYTATFDASKLPSGIYFYSLRSGGFSSTKKMILIK